jgi:hypothetical protein
MFIAIMLPADDMPAFSPLMPLYDIILLPLPAMAIIITLSPPCRHYSAFAAITPRLMPRFDYFRCCRHAYACLRCLYVAIVLPFRYFSDCHTPPCCCRRRDAPCRRIAAA